MEKNKKTQNIYIYISDIASGCSDQEPTCLSHEAIPLLLVLITEVEEAWSMEQELHQVVWDQQHQAQSVEAK